MKKIMLTMVLLLAVGCTGDKTTVINNNDRVSALEARADLNDQLNVLQNQRLDALEIALAAESEARLAADLQLSSDLQAEMDARIAADQELADLVAAEQAARESGDDELWAALQQEISNRIAGDQHSSNSLAAAVFSQTLVNLAVQGQIALINGKITTINNKITSLTNRVNSLEDDVDDLQDQINQLNSDMSTLQYNLQAQIDDLQDQADALSDRLDAEGVKVYKCNASSSTERMFKINGKYYAVMNRVTTESISVITGSSSTTFENPKLCLKDEKAKLPGGNGQCPSSWTAVGGNSVTVPTYSTGSKTVVTSVKIAMDLLTDGSYQTTDGGPACSFSISNGGTTATNLVQVQ